MGEGMFELKDMAGVDDVRRARYELWNGKHCWVWGLTIRQYLKLQREARRRLPDGGESFDEERYIICRFIECVRNSDRSDAKPIFNRRDHYEWLLERDMRTIQGAVALSMELSGELEPGVGAFFGSCAENDTGGSCDSASSG